jgi:hypothetical protein
LEKTQLETEKNLISLNKDYITSFNELINKHNEKYNLELKSIRSLIEAGLTKVDIKMEKDLKLYEENLTILKSNILEQKSNISNLEAFMKDNINEIEKKMDISKNLNGDYFTKFDLLSNSFKQFMEESLKLIDTKNKETQDILNKKIKDEINKLNEELIKRTEHYDKHFSDIEDKIKDIRAQVIAILKTGKLDLKEADSSEKEDKKETSSFNKFIIRDFVQKLFDENFNVVKETFNGYEKDLFNNMNNKIEEAKDKFSLEQVESMKKIQEMINTKTGEVKDRIIELIHEESAVKDGKVQEYIVETELRINKKYDENIKRIEEDLESLTLKIGLGPE